MTKITQNQQANANFILRLFAFTTLVYGLSACSSHPHLDCCVTIGKQFEDKWKVEKIYVFGNDNYNKPVGMFEGEFDITRSSDPGVFNFVPDANFSRLSGDWGKLQLQYKPGIQTNNPLALVAEQICQDNQGSENSKSNIVSANVHYDFTNLVGRELESLQGILKSDNNDQNGKDKKKVTIFHFKDVTEKDPRKIDILIFVCGDDECKSSKMIHGKQR